MSEVKEDLVLALEGMVAFWDTPEALREEHPVIIRMARAALAKAKQPAFPPDAPACHTVRCSAPATKRASWPGVPVRRFCAPCAVRAKRVAEAMGFDLPVFELEG